MGGTSDNTGRPKNAPKVRSTPPPAPPKRPPPVRFRSERKALTKPRRVRGGIKLTDSGEERAGWIRQRIARLVEQAAPGEAYREGREYAELGQTRRLVFEDGRVQASVQGRADRAYTTGLRLEHFEGAQRDEVVGAMGESAVYAAKLLAGELPANIEDVFAPLGLKLLPSEPEDVMPTCTCSDWSEKSPWCKHAVCAALLVAERLASEPFLIFGLRGLPAAELLESLREQRGRPVSSGGAPTPVYRPHPPVPVQAGETFDEDELDRFWSTGPELDQVDTPMSAPEVPHLLLRRLGPSPLEGRFPMLGLLQTCYELIGEAALREDEPGAGEDEDPDGGPGEGSAGD